MDAVNLTRAELAAEEIRRNIIAGGYLSGERLVEMTLARRLGISQITVRDALRVLEQQGWVVKQPRRGVYVRDFTPETASELYILFGAIERTVIDALCSLSSRKTILKPAYACLDAAEAHFLRGQRREGIGQLFDTHVTLAEATRREQTMQLLKGIINQARLLEAMRQSRIPSNANEFNQYVAAHRTMFLHIEHGAVAEAHQQLGLILNTYTQNVLDALTVR
ncbi:MAG: GntR family transcriptional regulator [Pleurocapsa minor GSE-CHR-MK-17-07R]|jgi:DNA-binding GntR family transcriptional regulator|nr:GntR family transcriptional regulator [Pleurocapsa minor GSE-CHR-MK 17-07R]